MPGLPGAFRSGRNVRPGFSLIELVVVIAVALVLTGLLMPAMQQLQENAHRIICLSNLQQVGTSFIMYGHEHKDALPFSTVLHQQQSPQELMASRNGGYNGNWDGIGLLYSEGFCSAPECFYCPSHHGDHPYERYADVWASPVPGAPIYTNYHYAGDIEWDGTQMRRRLLDGYTLVLATDGLRTASDFNHVVGMNVLRGDGSVRWRDDTHHILEQLPLEAGGPAPIGYTFIWNDVQNQR